MGTVEHFEELRIWQDARVQVRAVYQDMNSVRDCGFREQLQRAALSVMNNIAEGFERQTDREFAQFLNIAKGSAGEVRSMYYAAEDLGYMSASAAEQRRSFAAMLSQGIKALQSYLK